MKKKLFMFVLFAFGLLLVPGVDAAAKEPVYEKGNNLFLLTEQQLQLRQEQTKKLVLQ